MKTDLFFACRRNLVRLLQDRRGATAVIVALTLAALIGFAGLGVETGLWYAIKRYNQSAADVAAISGAMEQAGGGAYKTDICALAARAAQANGFAVSNNCPNSSPSTQSDCTSLLTTSGAMCVNNPPLFSNTGLNGLSNYVEVVLTQQQSTFFSFLSLANANVTIDTRAIAGLKAFSTCMIALDTSGTDLKNNGNANLTLNNCSFASNSTSNKNPCSVVFNGGVTMTAAAISTAGCAKITGKSNFISPPVTTNASAVADPYAGQITVPPIAGLPNRGCPPQTGGTFHPGYYTCGKNNAAMLFTSGTTILCPGVYVLDGDQNNNGQGFGIHGTGTTVTLGTSVQCPGSTTNGVTIITTCTSNPSTCGGSLQIGNNGVSDLPTVTLSAPTTSPQAGIPADILFYQVASTADLQNNHGSTLAGGAGVSLNGVVYTPATQISLQGNPTFGSCTELIAGSYVIGGNPVMNAPANSCGINTQSVSTLVLAE